MKKQKPETRYYSSFSDDFVESGNQSFQLPEDYVWIRKSPLYRVVSNGLYLLAALAAVLYCRFWLHVKLENRAVLDACAQSGCFLYGNHTQPIGDALIPLRIFAPKRHYTVVSPANLGIPALGPLLPMIGALPLPDSIAGMKKLKEAIQLRIAEKSSVMFYPEAHVWPWYTGIRPFPAASFGFPVGCRAPSFCVTTTYQKRKFRKKPGVTVYLDGPFYPDASLPKKEQKERLRDEIYDCMVRRSRSSTCQYIQYDKEG